MAQAYDHSTIEKKAQEKWAALNLSLTDVGDENKEPYYLLCEFPYPSGDLHTGHWYAFAVTDIYARYLRMQGKNVLFPIGFDAFGLPAENAAIRNNADPKEWTYKNIERMRTQLASMGASFDWSKEVTTADPSYYRWTQWLFAKLFEHGLAYRKEASVKWCPKDQTVLANEQVIDGCCERCGTPVEEKRLTQWFLKITEYAERLLADLEPLPWREEIKEAQRAWIGKSEGAYIEFPISGREEKVKVFTTRPDTIYGATYVVLAPEHFLISTLLGVVSNKKEVEKYIAATTKKTERERSENKEKTGIKLEGVTAINPATKEEIPIYIADYVLASYGTGAVMAVPAHDDRDFEFAKKFDLPIREVIEPVTGKPLPDEQFRKSIVAVVENKKTGQILCLDWTDEYGGVLFIGGGLEEGEDPAAAAVREIKEETGYKNLRVLGTLGKSHHHYYAFSKKIARNVEVIGVHLELVDDERNEPALEENEKNRFSVLWLTKDEAERKVKDENHALVFRRFIRNKPYTGNGILANSGTFSGRESEEAMADIVQAVGGEQALQYRLRDWLVSRQRYWGCPIPIVYDPEGKPHVVPAEHLPWLLPTDVNFKPTGKAPLASSKELRERVTKIFGEGWTPEYDTLDTFVDSAWYFMRYLDPQDTHSFSDVALMKKWLPINRYSGGSEHTTMHLLYARFFYKALYDLALVPTAEPFAERFNRGIILGPDGAKMSKSRGNVVNPDDFVAKYGADAVRLYLAFIGPYNEAGSYPWNLEGVASMRKFLDRVVRLFARVDKEEMPRELARRLAQTGAKVGEDCKRFKFNTALAALMSLLNALEKLQNVPASALREFTLLLAPFAPHLSEHLWERLGGEGSVHQTLWPSSDSSLFAKNEAEIVVQVAGRRRGSVQLRAEASEAEALAEALKISAVQNALGGKEPSRVIYVPGRILNLVV
ncbi:leucine--tRNA ligase [Candidatus Kaiserbacteria bacterium]|nr:leucine--tRNA ligase [Candidatus Kaiserbacteria bacterium]